MDELVNHFWKKAEKKILKYNEIQPTIFGIGQNLEGNYHKVDLGIEMDSKNWGDPDHRFDMYYKAFLRKKEWRLDGIMSIFESWVTTLDVKEMILLGLSPDGIKTQEDFLDLRDRYPNLFQKSESLSIYVEYRGETRLVWGRIFREENRMDGRVTYLSEYVEHNEESMDGIIKDARQKAYDDD